ncbi:MAG: FAD:protein FMN transferase [Desulfopila sp.]
MAAAPETQTRLTRRTFLKIASATAAVAGVGYLGINRYQAGGYTLKNSRSMMGTIVNFTIIGSSKERCYEALQSAATHMETTGTAVNGYIDDSPLTRLNQQGILHDSDPTLRKVVIMAKELSRLTDGAFDPTVLPLVGLYKNIRQGGPLPSQEKIDAALSLVGYQNIIIEGTTIRYAKPGMGMTLDGIGKGYVVDEGMRILNEMGIENGYIEAGGDLMASGTKPSGKPWTFAIQNPRPQHKAELRHITLRDRAIATSGDYMQAYTTDRRYHHILHPKTGFSPPELASCSILAPSVARADGLATAAMVMGPQRSIDLLKPLPACEGFLVGKDLTTYSTKDFFTNNENI